MPDGQVLCLDDGRIRIEYLNGICQYISASAKPALLAALLERESGIEVDVIETRYSEGFTPEFIDGFIIELIDPVAKLKTGRAILISLDDIEDPSSL